MPKWIPVVFAIITPLSFTAYGVLTKHLTSEKVGMNINRTISSVYLIVNTLIIMIAIPFWYYTEFHQDLFWIGFIAAISDQIGMIFLSNAFTLGPAGPISAIIGISNPLLILVECIKNWKMISLSEGIGFILVIYGALILVIPETFEKFCFPCCFKNKKNKII